MCAPDQQQQWRKLCALTISTIIGRWGFSVPLIYMKLLGARGYVSLMFSTMMGSVLERDLGELKSRSLQ